MIKKLIALLIVLGIFLGEALSLMVIFMAVKLIIRKSPLMEKKVESADDGMNISIYVYDQNAYNTQGEEKAITLREARDRPLKMDAYLKLLVNPRKGVISWEEVKAPDVPKKALEQLDQ